MMLRPCLAFVGLLALLNSSVFGAEVVTGIMVKRELSGLENFAADSLPSGWRRVFRGSESGAASNLEAMTARNQFEWLASGLETNQVSRGRTLATQWDHVYRFLLNPPPGLGSIRVAEPPVQHLHRKRKTTPSLSVSAEVAAEDLWTDGRRLGIWPAKDHPAWHLGDEQTQLGAALRQVEEDGVTYRARVAIIDSDFNFRHHYLRGIDRTNKHWVTPSGNFAGPGHGTGTLGILAGQKSWLQGENIGPVEIHGANPHARIIPIAGASGVAHLISTRSISEGLAHAARLRVDVVSLSMGGRPSRAVMDAVNECYMNGVAVYAASGNYFKLPFIWFSTPKFIVYPAGLSSCVGVAGATAAERPYFRPPSWFGWTLNFSAWIMRGSARPVWQMNRVVSGYSPNITWAQYNSENVISLAGSGTSSATPQAAGAASLWYEKHRTKVLELAGNQPWRKAELIMQASLRSSQIPEGSRSGCSISRTSAGAEYRVSPLFGRGIIKAHDALRLKPQQAWLDEIKDEPQRARSPGNWLVLLAGIAFPVKPSGLESFAAPSVHEAAFRRAAAEAFPEFSERQLNLENAAASPVMPDAVLNSLALEAEQQLCEYARFDALNWREKGEISQSRARAALRYLSGSRCSTALRKTVKAMRRELTKKSP